MRFHYPTYVTNVTYGGWTLYLGASNIAGPLHFSSESA